MLFLLNLTMAAEKLPYRSDRLGEPDALDADARGKRHAASRARCRMSGRGIAMAMPFLTASRSLPPAGPWPNDARSSGAVEDRMRKTRIVCRHPLLLLPSLMT